MANTITVQGENGHVFDVDLGPPNTPQRRQYDAFIARGALKVVAGHYPPEDPEAMVEPPVSDTEPPPTPVGELPRPRVRDGIDVWRTWALDQGADPVFVAGATKEELQAWAPETPGDPEEN